MSKTLSFSHSHLYYGLIGCLVVWLCLTIAALLQTVLKLNQVQQLNSLPISPQQQAIQQAIETIDQQTVFIKKTTK